MRPSRRQPDELRAVSLERGVVLAFFKTDPTAAPWFLKRTVTGQPPQVTAGASVSGGPPPLSVNFMASATDPDGTIGAYQWTFDHGTLSTAQNPAKTFPAPGNYSVRLTVTDNSGNTTLRTLPISVAPAQSSPTPTSTPTPTANPNTAYANTNAPPHTHSNPNPPPPRRPQLLHPLQLRRHAGTGHQPLDSDASSDR